MMTNNNSKKNIIVIDDDDMVNEVLSFILEEEYDVSTFFTAEDALQNGHISNADAIITDVNLPGMDGIDLLQQVYQVDPDIPVIVITAYNDIDVAISALKNGAFDFILKPFKNDQIILSVRKAIERHELLRQNIQLMDELKSKNRELELLNKKIQRRNLEIENELDIAGNLQQCLFPVVFPDLENFSFELRYQPVEKISGDFFDFLFFDEKRFVLIFADVSGHGVPAALYSAMVKTGISTIGSPDISPAEFMKEINMFLIGSQKTMSYNYATLFYALFDLEKGNIQYCNAGLPSPALIRDDIEMELLETTGPFVGIFESSEYFQKEVSFKEGDSIVLFTDGAFECPDLRDRVMGQKQFIEKIRENRHLDIHQLVAELYEVIHHYCGPDRFVDDVTILGVNYNPGK